MRLADERCVGDVGVGGGLGRVRREIRGGWCCCCYCCCSAELALGVLFALESEEEENERTNERTILRETNVTDNLLQISKRCFFSLKIALVAANLKTRMGDKFWTLITLTHRRLNWVDVRWDELSWADIAPLKISKHQPISHMYAEAHAGHACLALPICDKSNRSLTHRHYKLAQQTSKSPNLLAKWSQLPACLLVCLLVILTGRRRTQEDDLLRASSLVPSSNYHHQHRHYIFTLLYYMNKSAGRSLRNKNMSQPSRVLVFWDFWNLRAEWTWTRCLLPNQSHLDTHKHTHTQTRISTELNQTLPTKSKARQASQAHHESTFCLATTSELLLKANLLAELIFSPLSSGSLIDLEKSA